MKDDEKADEKFERRLSISAYTPYNNIDEFIGVRHSSWSLNE